jgi:hypothetical protein
LYKDIARAGATSGIPTRLFAADGFVYFAANDYNGTTPDAWRSDGTPDGTAPISQAPKGTFLSFPSNAAFFAQMGGDVYYFFTDDTHGAELWKSDQPDFATLGGGGVLTVSGTGGNDAIDVSTDGSGLHVTLNGLVENFAAGTVTSLVIAGKTGVDTVNVTGGSVTFGGGDSGTDTINLTVHIAASASATFAGTQRVSSLVVDGGGNAALAPGGGSALVVNTVSLSGSAVLNLNDNAMIIRGSTVTAAANLLQLGFNGGNWNGAGGITSGNAASDPNDLTALGYASNADLGLTSFGGVTGLTPADVLVKYTYYGDANLDGQVDIGDLGLLAGAWQQSGKGWFDGDFTYNNTVDIGDLGLLAGNWQAGVGNPL